MARAQKNRRPKNLISLLLQSSSLSGIKISRALLVLLVGFWLTPIWASEDLSIIYSGNLDGELEPCGCSPEGNLGGVKRRATLLSQLRKEIPGLVVISAGGLLSTDGPGDRIKSEYILKGFGALGYDAIAVQWRDLSYSPEFASNVSLPWVVSNWRGSAQSAKGFSMRRVVTRGKQKLAFFGWLNPQESPLKDMQGGHNLADESSVELTQALQKAHQSGHLTVLFTTMTSTQMANVVDLSAVDILIVRAAYEEYGEARIEGGTLIVQPGSRGMRLGRLDLKVAGGRIQDWQHTVLPMPQTMADFPPMASWYDDYNARVKKDYLKRIEERKKQTAGTSPFVGEEVCQTCHVSQHKTWSGSQHAIAYEDLELVEKAFDPACIKCHTVGFDEPGGFFDMNITNHLMGVQCESCHGAGRQHVEKAGAVALPNAAWSKDQICGQCHTQKHSPSFDFGLYWPKIAH